MLRNARIWGGQVRRGWLLAACVAFFAAVAATAVAPQASAASSSRWIVMLADGADPLGMAHSFGGRDVHGFTEAFTGFAATMTDAQARELSGDSRVQSMEKDRTVVKRPKDPDNEVKRKSRRGSLGRLHDDTPSTQGIPLGIKRIGGLQSPTARIDGRDQRVNADIAVVDGGVQNHADLNVFRHKDCVGDGVLTDLDGHGTEVAGVAAAIDNKIGVVGVAPGARIWDVRIFGADGSLTQESALCGVDYLAANSRQIDVAVLSFAIDGTIDGPCGRKRQPAGGLLGILPKFEVVDPLHAGICKAVALGIVTVAAAGNDGRDATNTLPAAYPEVIAVSAFDDTDGKPGGLGPDNCFAGEPDDSFAFFSNFGPVIDFAAPGTCVLTTYPNNTYTITDGTSFAAPHVAGAAALIKSKLPIPVTVVPGLLPVPALPQLPPVDVVRELLKLRGEHTALPGDPDGIHEPIINVRGLSRTTPFDIVSHHI
jgi:subtilisin family serine protease